MAALEQKEKRNWLLRCWATLRLHYTKWSDGKWILYVRADGVWICRYFQSSSFREFFLRPQSASLVICRTSNSSGLFERYAARSARLAYYFIARVCCPRRKSIVRFCRWKSSYLGLTSPPRGSNLVSVVSSSVQAFRWFGGLLLAVIWRRKRCRQRWATFSTISHDIILHGPPGYLNHFCRCTISSGGCCETSICQKKGQHNLAFSFFNAALASLLLESTLASETVLPYNLCCFLVSLFAHPMPGVGRACRQNLSANDLQRVKLYLHVFASKLHCRAWYRLPLLLFQFSLCPWTFQFFGSIQTEVNWSATSTKMAPVSLEAMIACASISAIPPPKALLQWRKPVGCFRSWRDGRMQPAALIRFCSNCIYLRHWGLFLKIWHFSKSALADGPL